MGDVELPRPAQDSRDGIGRALQSQRAPINERRSVAGDEDENFRRIVELHRLNGKVAEEVLWDVVDEDKDQSESAEKVEPKITRLSSRHGAESQNYDLVVAALHRQPSKTKRSRRRNAAVQAASMPSATEAAERAPRRLTRLLTP